ncbi:MAG TPA: FAD-dependent oxidoreductase, partial [Candidatus Kapabacteria bacterium]|nr:FAD-dependent oxidoreductase [Candidatus Kapabacteria bacterium]
MSQLQLGLSDFTYSDLYDPQALSRLHSVFVKSIADQSLIGRWNAYSASGGEGMGPVDISNLLVDMAPYVGTFIAKLFGIEDLRSAQIALADREKVIFEFKRDFLQRRAMKKYSTLEKCLAVGTISELESTYESLKASNADLFSHADEELGAARLAMKVAEGEKSGSIGTDVVAKFDAYVAACVYDEHLHEKVKYWASYHIPKNLDYDNLVQIIRPESLIPEKFIGPEEEYRRRDGFELTDKRMNPREVRGETEYCIFCHDRSKDSCSKGIHEKDGATKKNPLGIPLAGCPLDEKISEMHMVLSKGDAISALALIMLDNPMCPGTGHRICNDCMKSCIYQKQSPVNIPQAETGALTDVLRMRWGVEIYGLLTRWNPLNIRRPYALPYSGKKALVVGLGPAGYTLSHYLLNEGFGVAGIDGLKIEPLDRDLTGYIDDNNKWIAPKPIQDWSEIYNHLDKRPMDGFGGVAEYGITVRWDKNFLTLIYLTLARRNSFAIYGGVRFGGTITIEDAFERYGFDHIAIASGAGKPTIVPMKNNLIRGIRKASDFLMALQLTGAAKKNNLANLQVQLPAVVIGGGLTAIDTATELAAYYPIQVEKILNRYEIVMKENSDAFVESLTPEDRLILDTFLEHGRAVRAERERAEATGEKPNFVPLVRQWGGV